MALPFVRDLFADVEKLPAFTRVASHLKDGTWDGLVICTHSYRKSVVDGFVAACCREASDWAVLD